MKKRKPTSGAVVPAAVPPSRSRWTWLGWGVALAAAVLPLWVSRDLPMVDLPQHLYVLEVLRHLHDPATPFPDLFAARSRFTPYLGYYAVVGALGQLMPLEVANRIWLTLVVAGYPLSMAFLLRSLRRPAWPAMLGALFAYGDTFAWGFVNTLGALPLAIVALGAFVRAITEPRARVRWTITFAGSALASFLTHPAAMAFLALAVPWALLTSRAADDGRDPGARGWLARRALPIAGLLPVLVALAVWFATSGAEASTAPGGGHSAVRSLFHRDDMVWETLRANLGAFLWLLANQFQDGTDQIALLATLVIFAAAPIARLFEDPPVAGERPTWLERVRPLGLAGIGFGLFLTLPLSIRGQIMYLSPRYAALTALLALGLVPRLGRRATAILSTCAVLTMVAGGLILARGFRRFDQEASALRRLAPACGPRPRIMGLVFEPYSRIVSRPVYLHGAVLLARLRLGVPNYSLAGGNQIPLRYRGAAPPGLRSEWEPREFDYAALGASYDHFLLRDASPDSVFGARLGTELVVAAREGDWCLVRRRTSQASAHTSQIESVTRVTRTPPTQPSGR